MHRQNPLQQGFVGYTSGGARSLVDSADDSNQMQEMKGSMLGGENRQKIESPQNYGFTSVVLPAKKGKDGKIEDSAEAYMSFLGGNRSFPVATVMDDRRHRPMGLKPGENAQYDDIGQMTLMRRGGLFLLSLDSEDESQSQQSGSGGGSPTPTQQAAAGGSSQGKKVERMVSLRHVEKKKQDRPKPKGGSAGGTDSGGGGAGGNPAVASQQQLGPEALAAEQEQETKAKEARQNHKHEGESVNNEVRLTAKRIEFRTGDDLVGHYDKGSNTWEIYEKAGKFKVIIKGDKIVCQHEGNQKSLRVDATHIHMKFNDNVIWVDNAGCWSSKVIAVKPDNCS